MTQLQVAYQKNRLEEEANKIKSREARVKEKDLTLKQEKQAQELKTAWDKHIKEYGNVEDSGKLNWLDSALNTNRTQSVKNVFSSVADVFKSLFSGFHL